MSLHPPVVREPENHTETLFAGKSGFYLCTLMALRVQPQHARAETMWMGCGGDPQARRAGGGNVWIIARAHADGTKCGALSC